MLPCHSFYICGTWRSKEVGGLKLSYGGNEKEPQTRGTFMERHENTAQGVDH